MYRIIGSDRQQYGPVTADEVYQWIVEKRVDEKTLIQKEGEADWRLLSTFPEFVGALGGTAAVTAEEILGRDFKIDIGSCVSRSWQLVKDHFWMTVGASFLILLIGFLAGGLGGFLNGFSHGFFRRPITVTTWASDFAVNFVITSLISGACMGGLYWFFLKLIRGQSADISDAFAGFGKPYLQLTLAHIVMTFLIYVGLILCILPGIYLGVAWVFTLPLIIDKRLKFWNAMELSRKVIAKNWWSMFALLLLIALISIAGLLACCIGIFVTAPIAYGALMYAYEDIFGFQNSKATGSIPGVDLPVD